MDNTYYIVISIILAVPSTIYIIETIIEPYKNKIGSIPNILIIITVTITIIFLSIKHTAITSFLAYTTSITALWFYKINQHNKNQK